MFKPQSPLNHTPTTPLSNIYRLYSPSNKIPTQQRYPYKKNTQPSIIQLVFTHPQLLFIQPQNDNNNNQKHAITEFNMIKNIVQRKKKHHNMDIQKNQISKKPMTAPHLRRIKYHEDNVENNLNVEKQHGRTFTHNFYNKKSSQVNFFNIDKATPTLLQQSSSTFQPTHRPKTIKPVTSQQKRPIDKNNPIHSQRTEFPSHKDKTKPPYDLFQQKKKKIEHKYEQNKLQREKLFQSDPNTQIYLNMQAKFSKYFNKLK